MPRAPRKSCPPAPRRCATPPTAKALFAACASAPAWNWRSFQAKPRRGFHLAVVHGLRLDPAQRLLIIDIGGGSTEFINARPAAKLQVASLQIGSVRLTERIIHHDPPNAREAADLRLAIDAELTGLGWSLETDLLVGIPAP